MAPGVYAGGAVSLTGALELTGSADSVWVFQAASTLVIGSGSIITLSGGATSCNVFWQVGSSATVGTGADFVGTVMAAESITANTSATINGRLLAGNGAVTLDSNVITAPTDCAGPGEVVTSPTITSTAPPSGQSGTPYTHTVTASGTRAATFTVTSGALPEGLTLDAATGVLSGVPTADGTFTVTVTASNGTAPDATATYEIVIAPAPVPVTPPPEILPVTGADGGAAALIAAALLAFGSTLLLVARPRAERPIALQVD